MWLVSGDVGNPTVPRDTSGLQLTWQRSFAKPSGSLARMHEPVAKGKYRGIVSLRAFCSLTSDTTHSTGIGDNLFVCCLYCWLAYVDFQQKQPVKCSSHTYIIIPTAPTL